MTLPSYFNFISLYITSHFTLHYTLSRFHQIFHPASSCCFSPPQNGQVKWQHTKLKQGRGKGNNKKLQQSWTLPAHPSLVKILSKSAASQADGLRQIGRLHFLQITRDRSISSPCLHHTESPIIPTHNLQPYSLLLVSNVALFARDNNPFL